MTCTICNNPKRAQIEQAILLKDFEGETKTLREIANEFKVDYRELQIHTLRHMFEDVEVTTEQISPESLKSISSEVKRREAEVLRNVMEMELLTFKNLSGKINSMISHHQVTVTPTRDKKGNMQTPDGGHWTLMQLQKPMVDLYLGAGQSIRATIQKISDLNTAVNGEKDEALSSIAGLVDKISSARKNRNDSEGLHIRDNDDT